MILPTKREVDWELIYQRKQAQNNKDNIHKNKHRVDHDHKVRDNVMLTKHTAYKYETPYTGPFVITQHFTNEMINLRYMVQQKLGIINVALFYLNRILKLKILIQKIHLVVSAYNYKLYASVNILKI